MTTTAADQDLIDSAHEAWEAAIAIEPALGRVDAAQLATIERQIERVDALRVASPYRGVPSSLSQPGSEHEVEARTMIANVYARSAVVAVAAGRADIADRWLGIAVELAVEPELRREIEAARREPEAYRQLAHGRNLMRNGKERAAVKLWTALSKRGSGDPLAALAVAALDAPRPLNGKMPGLGSVNGFGTSFFGRRDRWDDDSYVTTQCITALFVPVFPLSAYRVQDSGDGYMVMAKHRLSRFARIVQLALPAAIVVAIAGAAIHSHLNDPTRLAQQRWDDMSERVAAASTPDVALKLLDDRLGSDDRFRVGASRVESAGAEVVRQTARLVPTPMARAHVDQASRVVRRYLALPTEARGGVARDAMLATLDGWVRQLASAELADARLMLLRQAKEIADARRGGPIDVQIREARITVAQARAEQDPLDSLAILMEAPDTDATRIATDIVKRLADAPSMLVEAGADLDTWLAQSVPDTALRERVVAQRTMALSTRDESKAEELSAAKLAAMQKARPWDQWVAVRLAQEAASEGKLDVAGTRLRKLGPPGLMIREGRMLLGQIASSEGKLDEADALLTGLLGARLERFVAASAELEATVKAIQSTVEGKLRTGDLPYELMTNLQTASEDKQGELVRAWFEKEVDRDAKVIAARAVLEATSDVVPISIASGSVKLRRAQSLDGAARDAMLLEAERAFLAVKSAAEGQPEFQINLGEIYARLGKVSESEAQFKAVLDGGEPRLSLAVAQVYRDIGNTARAKEVATKMYGSGANDIKYASAILMSLLSTDDEEQESWLRKADPSSPYVKAALLEREAHKADEQGKESECAAKYAQAAKMHLAAATGQQVAGFNNAAVAHQNRFECSGDLEAIDEATAAFERAYRVRGDEPIVVGNLAEAHRYKGLLKILGKRVDVRVLRPRTSQIESMIAMLLEGPERDAIRAELLAEPSLRRSRELYAQFQVLAPSNANSYMRQLLDADQRSDVTAAEAIVEAARRAKGLDLSEQRAHHDKAKAGENDAGDIEDSRTALARYDAMLAKKLDPRTRAAVLFMQLGSRSHLALYAGETEHYAVMRRAAKDIESGWPALRLAGFLHGVVIDEAGSAADAKAWLALRRERSAVSALGKLADSGSPLAMAVKSSPQWTEIAALLRADMSRPGIDDLRLARLIGDAALEQRMRAVVDDRLRRLQTELWALLQPWDDEAKEALAYLDRR